MLIDGISIGGEVAAGFEPVADAFARNFTRTDAYREVGAAVAAHHRGRCVVNLWSGDTGADEGAPWTSETLVNVWSTTKGLTACAVAMLVDRRAVGYDQTVASVWPEFAQGGKAEVTIGQVMSHQAALPGFVEPTTIEDQYDWESCCARLARQAPAWPPGTATSYHAMTFGWLAGEIVRRVTGQSLGAFVREVITGPLDADVFIGLPQGLEPRVARLLAPRLAPPDGPPIPLPARMALENPVQDPRAPNSRAWRAAEIPAANAQASALGLARFYAALGPDPSSGVARLLSPDGLAGLTRPATADGRKDMLMGFADSWGMGVLLNPDHIYGPGERAFGHSGWGGSFGCADPALGLSIGYVCNQMGGALVVDPRSVSLATAITQCAGRR